MSHRRFGHGGPELPQGGISKEEPELKNAIYAVYFSHYPPAAVIAAAWLPALVKTARLSTWEVCG